jgi:two-component system response regulator AtoC
MDHSWPGNVRELQNCMERAAIMARGMEVEPADLLLGGPPPDAATLGDVLDLSGTLADVARRGAEAAEEAAVRLALREAAGDRNAAAQRLGISASTLARRLKAFGLEH